MNVASARLLWQTAIFVIGLTAIACAETAAFPDREFQAKFDYCKTCHGVSGQGYHGAFPIPRLAGQQPEYIENQLRAFIEHRRREQVHVYCRACPESGDDQGSCHALQRAKP